MLFSQWELTELHAIQPMRELCMPRWAISLHWRENLTEERTGWGIDEGGKFYKEFSSTLGEWLIDIHPYMEGMKQLGNFLTLARFNKGWIREVENTGKCGGWISKVKICVQRCVGQPLQWEYSYSNPLCTIYAKQSLLVSWTQHLYSAKHAV